MMAFSSMRSDGGTPVRSIVEGDVMVWARRFWLRLQTLFTLNRVGQRLDDEIQFHLEEQIAENMAAGMSREEARYAAQRTFGNSTALKEETRETWGWIWFPLLRLCGKLMRLYLVSPDVYRCSSI